MTPIEKALAEIVANLGHLLGESVSAQSKINEFVIERLPQVSENEKREILTDQKSHMLRISQFQAKVEKMKSVLRD